MESKVFFRDQRLEGGTTRKNKKTQYMTYYILLESIF